jgi:A/G-specific adenine glycosylase
MSDPAALLRWYDASRRDLPWRRTTDPWAIWVSEAMLQQTRVETAIPYFGRFLERFPDPGALAAASEEEALASWSGLGYYRRVRQLRAAAAEVVRRGGIPHSAADLEQLPGVGPYTAAAIASIAFGEAAPVVDGNVERVLARRLALAEAPSRASAKRALRAAAAELLDPSRPGDSNQALMELGATICTPRAPDCSRCPLARGCLAFEAGATDRFPVRTARSAPRRIDWTIATVRADGRLLLARRAADEAVLPGMWEFPGVEAADAEAAPALERRYGGRWRLGRELVRFRHTVTFRAYAVGAFEARWEPEGVSEAGTLAWFEEDAARRLALSGAARKLLARLSGAS